MKPENKERLINLAINCALAAATCGISGLIGYKIGVKKAYTTVDKAIVYQISEGISSRPGEGINACAFGFDKNNNCVSAPVHVDWDK